MISVLLCILYLYALIYCNCLFVELLNSLCLYESQFEAPVGNGDIEVHCWTGKDVHSYNKDI